MGQRILSIIDSTNEWVGKIISFGIVIIAIVIGYEVISRFVFNNPTPWGQATAVLLFGVYMILGGGYTLLHEGHIRIDLFYGRWSPRGKAIADLATSVFVFAFLSALVWYTRIMAINSIRILERQGEELIAPPIYPSKTILFIGAVLILLQFIVHFIRDIMRVAGKGVK